MNKEFFAVVKFTMHGVNETLDLREAERYARRIWEAGQRNYKEGYGDSLDEISVYASESEMEMAISSDKEEGDK